VKVCTLDNLHDHIQTAMDWTNSHLHHFRIGQQLYGDPDLMQENFVEMGYQEFLEVISDPNTSDTRSCGSGSVATSTRRLSTRRRRPGRCTGACQTGGA
jgi:hypothetical protein